MRPSGRWTRRRSQDVRTRVDSSVVVEQGVEVLTDLDGTVEVVAQVRCHLFLVAGESVVRSDPLQPFGGLAEFLARVAGGVDERPARGGAWRDWGGAAVCLPVETGDRLPDLARGHVHGGE